MRHPEEREEILYSFAVEERHDRQTLERYLKIYPDLAEDLIDLSSEMRMDKLLGPTLDDACVDANRGAAWEQFLASTPSDAVEPAVSNPFLRFQAAPAFAQLARKLDVPRSFLAPLCDGLVAAKTIPAAFLRRLAQAMEEPIEVLEAFFASAKPRLPSLAYKSNEKPAVQEQKTFRDFVLATTMADEQRAALLKDCDDDGRD